MADGFDSESAESLDLSDDDVPVVLAVAGLLHRESFCGLTVSSP